MKNKAQIVIQLPSGEFLRTVDGVADATKNSFTPEYPEALVFNTIKSAKVALRTLKAFSYIGAEAILDYGLESERVVARF